MSCTLTIESLDEVASSWDEWRHSLKWGSIFVIPAWLKAWWHAFGRGAELHLGLMREGDEIVGFAPLQVKDKIASFVGSGDVCDYLDFAIAPGRETEFFELLLEDLRSQGVNKLVLAPVRPDSTVLTRLTDVAGARGYEILQRPEDVSIELDLPATWEEYLAGLKPKQRHEVRRKLRRLWLADSAEYHCLAIGGEAERHMDAFLKLFALTEPEKAGFMNSTMESFFRALATSMAEIELLRMGMLKVANAEAAMTIGFDYGGSYYLYNSAYDPGFSHLSVGLLCKVLCLKDSIERGRTRWDFLKGSEPYKYQLGGHEVPIYACDIAIA
jgi:CelD/BcsL family acetyltransferase involved in cellulose biosynthesis